MSVGLLTTSVTGISTPASAADIDEGFYVPDRPDDGYQGVTFRDVPEFTSTFSWLSVNGKTCEDLNDNCLSWVSVGSIPSGEFHALLGPCVTASDRDCLESVVYVNVDGSTIPGQFKRRFPERGANDFIGDPNRRLVSGGPASIWHFPGVAHRGGSDFFMRVGLQGRLSADGSSLLAVDPKSLSMHGAIYAVEEIPAPCSEDGVRQFCGPRLRTFSETVVGSPLGGVLISPYVGRWSRGPSDCIMTGDQKCLQRLAAPESAEFRLSIRLRHSPSGWFHGRFRDAEFAIDPLAVDGGYRMVVGGKAVAVPVVAAGGTLASLLPKIQEVYWGTGSFKSSPSYTRDFGCIKCTDPLTRNSTSAPLPDGKDSLEEFEVWRDYLGDKSTADLFSWSFRAISVQSNHQTRQCFEADGTVKGVVAVDAMVYSSGPPAYIDGALSYTVSSPHFTSGGSVRRGSYNLIIRSDVARCVYGFSSAPLQATIAVQDSAGGPVVATTNVSEAGGWLKLAAYNFEFSAPKIKVTLAQIAVPANRVVTPTVTSKRVITCLKGKKRMRLRGEKARCPVGYKQQRTS